MKYYQFRSGTGADKKGLGVSEVHNLEAGDDEFEAYRKRMMMAYRFRPNPLVSLSSVFIVDKTIWRNTITTTLLHCIFIF